MTFGEKVRELRIKKGYSQDQLASLTGVTKRTVRNWETEGKYPRSGELYEKLSEALGCTVQYLRGEQEMFFTILIIMCFTEIIQFVVNKIICS